MPAAHVLHTESPVSSQYVPRPHSVQPADAATGERRPAPLQCLGAVGKPYYCAPEICAPPAGGTARPTKPDNKSGDKH